MARTYAPHTHHSAFFYENILKTLLRGLEAGLSVPELAATLNMQGHKSPTGADHTAASVRGILVRMRECRGPFAMHALLGHLRGTFTGEQTRKLLKLIA